MRDEHKTVYAASASPTPLPTHLGGTAQQHSPDFEIDHIDSSEDEKHEQRGGPSGSGSTLSMPGYHQMLRSRGGAGGGDHHRHDNWGGRAGGGSPAKDENHVSFAKCLLLVYEKAINV